MTSPTGVRAAIYARISRDQQGQGLGVERQEQLCRDLAKSLQLDVCEVYTDNDISAYSGRHRPAYEQLLTDIQAGRIDAVLCYHSDRLMRRTRELERYIDICKPRGVVTHQVTAGLLDLSSATGLAVAKTVAAWSQHESDHKGERIMAQKAQAAAKGKFLGGRMPWGWQRTTGGVEVEPNAGMRILAGTSAIVAGKSLISVTRAWADGGVVSLSGTPMNTTQVRRVLLRPRNAGLLTFHGEVVADSWPAIVPLELFRQCEATLTSSERPRQSEAKFKYLLSGIVKCFCGRYMTGFGAEGYRRSYRCKVHQEGGKYTPGHANRAMAPLDDYVKTAAAAYLERDDFKSAVRATAQQLAEKERPAKSADIGELIDRKNALARMFAQSLISESQLVEGSREIEQKLDSMKQQATTNLGSKVLAEFAFAEHPGEAFLAADADRQRELLRVVFDITLRPTGPHRGEFDPASVDMAPRLLA